MWPLLLLVRVAPRHHLNVSACHQISDVGVIAIARGCPELSYLDVSILQAYASYMKGNLLFEQDQNWDIALMNFKSARAVYEELGKYGNLENQVLCRERVEELEPSIQYCLHKIGESNLQTSDLLHIAEMEGLALDLFKAN
ncbi:hypothetical protein L1049_010815 [Liquidambar formosana]|uniref:Signal recognition particle subunit SRP68 n=1 Tax=Liquidambar formosana TaxID=63359 RepID=A0AAP0RRB8_LIQFO